MTCAIFLDSGPLGKIIHSQSTYKEEASLLEEFAKGKGASLLVAEIIEIETKRKLEKENFVKSIRKLRKIRQQERVILLTKQDRALAKAIEEKLAQEGKQVSSEIPSPDGILAAQAINFKVNEKDTEVVILTENVRDIIRVVRNGVRVWEYEEIIYKLRNNIEIDTVNVVDLISVSS